tara:strand:+ start:92240 stop:92374 length:135 start_codon:yes stop_codon:yes gene_type:complete
MNITINFKSGRSVNKWCADYAAAKSLRFSDSNILSVVDRSGKRC